MRAGDLVRFSIGAIPPGSREWRVGLLIEYRKWEKIATIMYKNELIRVAARDVQKFGKRYFEK